MRAENRLGIIVNSNRYFSFVEKLADAALEQEKQVRIHLLGPGCEFVKTDACTRLSRLARVTMCELTLQENADKLSSHSQRGVAVVPSQELSLVLKDCKRYVVF
jgi:hypothetical protein